MLVGLEDFAFRGRHAGVESEFARVDVGILCERIGCVERLCGTVDAVDAVHDDPTLGGVGAGYKRRAEPLRSSSTTASSILPAL